MNDYSELFYTMGAILVFSLFTLSSGRSFRTTSQQMVRADVEYRTITNAQNEIDHIRLITDEAALDSTSSEYFFKSFPHVKHVTYGEHHQYEEDIILKGHAYLLDETPNVKRFKVSVTAESQSVSPKIASTVEFIKTFRKAQN